MKIVQDEICVVRALPFRAIVRRPAETRGPFLQLPQPVAAQGGIVNSIDGTVILSLPAHIAILRAGSANSLTA